MTPRTRTVILTERRTAIRRLRRADVEDLIRHYRQVIEVTPTLEPSIYRLAVRGYVGSFRTSSVAWEIRPKLPWESLHWLTGLRTGSIGGSADEPGWTRRFADILAMRLADLIRERAAAGLLHEYTERTAVGSTVRGRIDLPRQLRDANRTPGLFHLVADEFTPDVIWNRLPRAAVSRLLDVPGLGSETRARLQTAFGLLDGVSDVTPTPEELRRLHFDHRSEPYRPLVSLCRLILDQAGPSTDSTGTAFLLNLEHLFQIHICEQLSRPGVLRNGQSIETQPEVMLTGDSASAPIELRPDILIRDRSGRPASVWDVKWKTLDQQHPHPTDVQQVLGYAAALELTSCGLIYPGRRSALETYTSPGSLISLSIYRLRLCGSAILRERSVARLARLVCAPGPCRQ